MIPCPLSMLALMQSSQGTVKLQAYAGIGCVVGIFLFIRGFIMLKYKRLILNTPFSKIRSACMGLVEVSGAARGKQTIPAGLTGQPCYYYEAVAWQLRQSGRNRQWQKVADERLCVPFFVEDGTGSVPVDPQGAQLDLHCNFKDQLSNSFFGSRDMIPENISKFLLRNGIDGSQSTKFEEYCIKPDDPMFVLGTLAQTSVITTGAPCPHLTLSGSAHGSRLNFLGPTSLKALRALGWVSEPTFVGTTPGWSACTAAGATSASPSPRSTPAAVWASVSIDDQSPSNQGVSVATALPDQTNDYTAGSAAADLAPNAPESELYPAAISKGSNQNPFIISWHSQKEVVRALAWKSALCIWGGPCLSLACLYILLLTLGRT
jgi:hypothetical protein